jgi:hypothetical protein
MTTVHGYDVSPDAKRFLLSRPAQSGEAESIKQIVLQNWLASIKK